MYCFSVLQEVPIQLLLHSQSQLHHMVGVISFNLAQVSVKFSHTFFLLLRWFLADVELEGEEHIP